MGNVIPLCASLAMLVPAVVTLVRLDKVENILSTIVGQSHGDGGLRSNLVKYGKSIVKVFFKLSLIPKSSKFKFIGYTIQW